MNTSSSSSNDNLATQLAASFAKVGFVPSPQVQQQLQQMSPPADPAAAAGGAPADPAAAAGAPPADPAAAGAPPGVDPSTGQPMPAATLEDVMAGMEQLAQMISQLPQAIAQLMAQQAPQGEQKKKSPAERMDAIEAQLAQLTGQPPAGGAPAPGGAPADPAAGGGASAPAAPPAA